MAEDYLNLIKNPRRRPSNSPAPEPSRGSAPFANPIIAPSTNAPYINNLDRLKSIDVQNSGNNNFQGYEPIRRDVSPHSNRFSAPITSIGERAGIPGPSLYGDVPQQPQGYKAPFIDLSSANREPTRDRSPTYGINRDISPRGRTLGVNDRPARIGTGSINSNTGLFGDTSYKGSTGDSGGITQRRSSGSQQSGPLKFSGGNRVNHDVSPKFGRKDKSPMIRKSRKKKMEIPIIVLGVLLIILIGVAAVVLLTPKPVNFCDSPLTGKTQRPNCTPCPEHGICKDGKLIACKDKFKPYKNECVEDYETAKKYGQYRSYINDHLAYLKGEKMCDPTIKDYLTLNEIQTQLKNKYGPKDRELESVKFESRWNDYFEKDEGLYIEKDMYGEDIYTTTDEGSPSLSCKFKLLWREGKLAGTWLALFIGTVVLAIKLIRLHVVYSRLGREMYDDVREYLTHFKNVSVKTLKKEFEHKHPGKNFEKIWSYVESYRKQDARIYQYYDIYQGVNQEFWLRVR